VKEKDFKKIIIPARDPLFSGLIHSFNIRYLDLNYTRSRMLRTLMKKKIE
jgi:hypothetical protein